MIKEKNAIYKVLKGVLARRFSLIISNKTENLCNLSPLETIFIFSFFLLHGDSLILLNLL